jgi:hypothetical protein
VLGPVKSRRLDHPITVSLEHLIPRDHLYRHLEAQLDLSFGRSWVLECYAERGRTSIDNVFNTLRRYAITSPIASAIALATASSSGC